MPLFAQKRDDATAAIYRVVRRDANNTSIEPQGGGPRQKLLTADLIFVDNAIDPPQPGVRRENVPLAVPVTPLRILYEWMKSPPPRRIGYQFLHEPLAEQFAIHSPRLVGLFLDSVEDFSCFANQHQPFHPQRAVTPEGRVRGGTTLLQTLAQNKGKIAIIDNHGNETDGYIYLDREIASGRIIDAGPVGHNPAGRGGIDFLLARQLNNQFIPVVAEVKIGNDKTPFLALIQALTYAAELTSESQRQRILNEYSTELRECDQFHTGMELLLLFVKLPPHLNAILDLTRRTIANLCADRRFRKYISRIVVACQPRMPPQNGPFQLKADEMEVFLAQD